MTGVFAQANLLFAPFKGLHYAEPGSLAQRVAPPYDVISPELRRTISRQDPNNIVNLDLPLGAPGEDPYRAAADLLSSWQRRGILVRDKEASAYVLRTTTRLEDGRELARTGVYLAVATLPFAPGSRVRPHEQTHDGPKEDRRRLTLATGANLSPIFLLAPDTSGSLAKNLEQITKEMKPWTSFEALGGKHEVWMVTGQLGLRLSMLASDNQVYIADGHHRYETAVYLRDDRDLQQKYRAGAERTLAHVVSFKDPGLDILPTHRIIEGQPLERAMVLKAANPFFQRAQPGEPAHFTAVFNDGSEAAMQLRPDADLSSFSDLPEHQAVRTLAVTIADVVFIRGVLDKLFGRAAKMRYTPVESEARTAATSGKDALAVLLPPTKLEEVRAVSDAGEFMPPKSTYFAPKVPTGIVMRLLEGD